MSVVNAPRGRGAEYGATHRLAALVAGLMLVAAGAGLLAGGLYRDNVMVSAGWRGNDLVTLTVALPLLLVALIGSVRGSVRGRLVLLGLLLYALYNYTFYLFGAAFNALFLVYVGLVTAAGFGLAFGLAALDVRTIGARRDARAPVRGVAVYTLAVAGLLGVFWVVMSGAFLFTGAPPPMVEATDHPTNVTGALDLSLVVAVGALAGAWLWQGRAWGYILAVIWNVKGAVYMLALSGASVAAWLAGPGDLTQLALWVPIAIGCLISAVLLLRGLGGGAG